jgi:hypothetical protein
MSVLQEEGGDTMNSIPKIVSGGQIGADRAALDWALDHNVQSGRVVSERAEGRRWAD